MVGDRRRPAARREGRGHGDLADGRGTVTAVRTRRPPAPPRRGAQPRRHPLRPHARATGSPSAAATRPTSSRRPSPTPTSTAVLASPLQRAQETATPLAAAHGLEIGTDDRLIEAGNSFEGQQGRRRRRRAARPAVLVAAAQPVHAVLGRAVPGDRRSACSPPCTGPASSPPGHEAVCVSHQLPIWTLRRFVSGRHLWHDPRRRQCALASLTSLVFDDAALVQVRYTEPAGGSDPDPDRGMNAASAVAAVRRRALLTGCSTSKDAVETGQDFTFVAPGGQTTILYDPPASRGALRGLSGESLLSPGHHDRARGLLRAASSCSTSGAPGAGRAAPRRRTCSSSRSRPPPTGCRCWGSTCATTAPPPPTSCATAASPTTRCSTRPAARSWR